MVVMVKTARQRWVEQGAMQEVGVVPVKVGVGVGEGGHSPAPGEEYGGGLRAVCFTGYSWKGSKETQGKNRAQVGMDGWLVKLLL